MARRGRRRSRARRIGSAIFVILLTLVVISASLLVAVLYIPAASRFVLVRAVSWYADRVPGEIFVREIEGSLARGTRVHDVHLEDTRGQPVVTARRLTLRLHPWPLLLARGHLDLTLEAATIHLRPEGGFADLVPEPDEPRDPTDRELGPDVPIGIEAGIELQDIDVTSHAPDGTRTALARGLRLSGSVAAKHRDASVSIEHVEGRFIEQVEMTDLRADASWSAPRLDVQRLVTTTDVGRIDHARGSYDFESGALSLDTEAALDPGALTDDPHALADIPEVELRALAGGARDGLWAWVEARAGEHLYARVSGLGAITPRPSGAFDVLFESRDPAQPIPSRLHGLAAVRARPKGIDGSGFTVCTSCPEPMLAAFEGRVADEQAWVGARAWLPGLTLRARAHAESGTLSSASLDLDLQETGPLRHALAPWIELPAIDGRATARVQCRGGELERCRVEATVADLVTPAIRARRIRAGADIRLVDRRRTGRAWMRVTDIRRDATRIGDLELTARGALERIEVQARLDGARDTQARVDMVVRPGERTRLDLRAFDAVYHELRATLVDPARVEIGEDELEIDNLRMQLGRGWVTTHGTLSTGAASDLRVTILDLNLTDLDRLLPGPALAGVVSSTLTLRGTLRRPEVSLDLRGRAVALDALDLGTVDASLSLRKGTLQGHARTRDGVASLARIQLRLPVRVDLSDRRFAVLGRTPLRLVVEIEDLDLARARPMPEADSGRFDGMVDALVRIEGQARAPVISGRLDARGLVFERELVGDAMASLSYADESAHARLELRGPLARRIRASTSLPVTVDLARPRLELHEHRELGLDVIAEGVDLAAPRAWVDGWPLAGLAELRLTGQGSLSDWHTRTVMRAREIAFDGRVIGAALVDLSMTSEASDLDLRLSGPLARRLHLRARGPLSIDPTRLEPRWNQSGQHVVDVLLRDGNLAALGRLGPRLPVSGHVDGVVHLEGSVGDASGVVDLATRRLAWRDRRLGRVWLAARYDGERLIALAEQQSGLGESIRARLEAPIMLVEDAPYVDWRTAEAHHLAVHAAGVDEHLLGAFVELPPDLELDASARILGRGSIDDFRVDARLRGSAGRGSTVGTHFFADARVGPDQQTMRALIGANGPESVNLSARAQARLVAIARGETAVHDVPFEARLEADRFPLDAFEPLLPAAMDDLRGVLQARAFGSGTIGAPDLRGFVEVQDGSVTVVPMYQRLEKASMFVLFDGSRIRLDDLTLRSGQGTTRARGQLILGTDATRGHVVVHTNDLPIVRPGLPIMTLDTRLVATLDARNTMNDVTVTAKNTRLQILATNVEAPAAIPSSDDVVVVDGRGREDRRAPRAPPTQVETEPAALPSDLRLRLRLGSPALVGGPNADMEWDGGLEITRIAGTTRVTGSLETTRGRVLLLGREFDIEQGVITLPEEEVVDPFINLVATTEMPDASVTVTIRGRASAPELRLSSSPAMTETEVFALLVTGSPGGAREEGSEFDAQAAAMLAAFNNPVISRQLRERIGIDRVGVAFGEDIENPIVTVGKRLNRKLYFETRYHHDAPPDANTAEVRLEYQFKPPAWSLQTHFGDAAAGGVEVWWQRRFGGRRRTRRD